MLPAPLPTITTGQCPKCGQSPPCQCSSTAETTPIPTFYGPHFPVAKDDEILAELKEIKNLLKAIWAEIS